MLNLQELVKARQIELPGRFCVGLDPDKGKIPECIEGPTDGIRAAIHMMGIVDATQMFAAAFKPQRAHWEALDDGIAGLRMLIAYIHTKYPDIPVFLDCKRGDIDRTQLMYGFAHFVLDEADGMNFNPYMGRDCLEQLVKADPSGVACLISLGRTSNPAAWQIQDARLTNGQRVWEYSLACAFAWAEDAHVTDRFGVVMGAAHDTSQLDQYNGSIAETEYGDARIFDHHLYRAREIVGDEVLILTPGLGKQSGHTEATIHGAWRGPGTLLPSSSSGITQASLGKDWAAAAENAAMKQCDANGAVIAKIGMNLNH
jgi:orotidine-5'-phosphate decarboxylase